MGNLCRPGHITAAFARSHRPTSLLIRGVTWSQWSHVAIVLPNRSAIIEAVWPDGVRYSDLPILERRSSRLAVVRFRVPEPENGLEFARRQVGKPYDYWGVIGLGLHREWQDPTSWWCSELLEATLAHAGRQRFRADLQRVTQQHSWMVR